MSSPLDQLGRAIALLGLVPLVVAACGLLLLIWSLP